MICGGQSGTGAGFLRVLRFPLPVSIPPTAPHSSYIIRGWYNRPVSGRRTKWTHSHLSARIETKFRGSTRLDHYRFLPDTLQFIINLSYHSTLYSLAIRNIVTTSEIGGSDGQGM
jgi:hypothetical protein